MYMIDSPSVQFLAVVVDRGPCRSRQQAQVAPGVRVQPQGDLSYSHIHSDKHYFLRDSCKNTSIMVDSNGFSLEIGNKKLQDVASNLERLSII